MSKWRIGTQALTFSVAVALAASGAAQGAERTTPSGFPVPRYITLKFSKVNARAGPGDDHRLLFVFRTKGLPLQVIAETSEWRRVCDPEGQVSWVHKRVTDGRRAVINTTRRPVPIVQSPKPTADPVAFLNVRAMAELDRCRKGWCKVRAGTAKGWVREGRLWGTRETPQCTLRPLAALW